VRLEWDEKDCTDRGWCGWIDHPDREWHERGIGHPCVGNYLDYAGTGEPGRDGKLVHAIAYACFVDHLGLQSTWHLGCSWHATAAEARAWVESTVRASIGQRTPSTLVGFETDGAPIVERPAA